MSDNHPNELNITQTGDHSVTVVAQQGSTVNLQYHQTYSDLSAALENSASKIGKYHIDRKETDTLLEWIKNSPEPIGENHEKRITALLGKAGSGKTVIMKDVLLALNRDEQCRVLAIKSDIFYDGDNNRSLNEIAGLGKPVVQVIRELAVQGKTILIIDQIDALSAVLSSKRKPLAEMLALIRSASKIPNVRIITSCRPYDFYYDQSFADLRSCHQVMVGELEETEIRQALAQNNLVSDKHLAPELLKLLANPLHLSLYCSILPENQMPDIRSLTDLYASLWNEMLDHCPSEADEIVNFLWNFCTLLYEKQTLSVNIDLLPSKWHKVINELISKGILVKNNKVVQFMHQTLFDYVFARLFFEKQQTLEDMFETKHQGLFVRNHLKQILEYQHTTDSDGFLRNVHTILFDKTDDRFRYKYRFHIRHLVLSILAGFDSYDAIDRTLIWNEIFTNRLYLFHFTNTITTYAGFSLYRDWIDKKGGFFAVDKTQQDYMFTIFGKVLYSNFQETVSYMRTLCEPRLSDYHRKRLITLIERQGRVDFSEDLKFVVQFLDDDEATLVFPMLMHTNTIHNTDWVIARLKQCVLKIYENNKKAPSLRFQPDISHNIQLIYDDLKKRFPDKAYRFAYDIVKYVATLSVLDAEDDIRNSMAYWIYNRHNSHSSDFHEELVDDMMDYWAQRLQAEPHGNEMEELNELVHTDLTIMHVVAAQALCDGINQYQEAAFQYLKNNINRHFHSSLLLHYQIKLFRAWVTSTPSLEELSTLLDIIKTLMPDWEKIPLTHPNRQRPISDIGRTRAQYDHCIPTSLLKQFPEEYQYYQKAKRRFKYLENEEPSRITTYCGYPSVKSETVEHIQDDSDILNLMRSYNKDNLHDFENPSMSGNSELLAQKAKSQPERFLHIYLKALEDKSIHIKYTLDGLGTLTQSGLAQNQLDNLFCRTIEAVRTRENLEQPQTNSILCMRIDYYIQNRLHMPRQVYDFVKNIVLHPYSDKDETDNIDYNLPINRERGRAIDLLVCTSYYDTEYGNDILDTMEQIVPVASVTSKVGMLFRMACLLNVDYQRTLNLFLAVTQDGNPNYFKLPVHNANPLLYFIGKDFRQLIPYFRMAMKSDMGNDVTADWLFRAWLCSNREAKDMLFELVDKSKAARVKAIDFVGRHCDKKFAEPMMEVLLRYLDYGEKELGREYDEIFSHLADWETSLDSRKFLDKFIKSQVCIYCSHEIYQYLKYLAENDPNYCLDLLTKLYNKKSSKHAENTEECPLEDNELQEITEILIDAYNNVRVYDKDNQSLESAMDLLDDLLEKEDVNYYLNRCLQTLEE